MAPKAYRNDSSEVSHLWWLIRELMQLLAAVLPYVVQDFYMAWCLSLLSYMADLARWRATSLIFHLHVCIQYNLNTPNQATFKTNNSNTIRIKYQTEVRLEFRGICGISDADAKYSHTTTVAVLWRLQ